MGTWRKAVGAGLAVVLAGAAPGMAQGVAPGLAQRSVAQGAALGLAAAAGVQLGTADYVDPDGGADKDLTIEDGSYRVTLVTGDTVHVTRDGKETRLAITPVRRADGTMPSFAQQELDGHHYVIPSDVRHFVPTQLDRRLFDVTGLIAAGYDDDRAASVPVIVQTREAGTKTDPGKGVNWKGLGVAKGKSLRSIGSVAGKVSKSTAKGKLVEAVRESAEQDAGAQTQRGIVPSPAEQGTSGITKVWLDAKVKALDTTSTPQVGAPQAWADGHTGEGIKVAVLDTGVDAEHPDLADAVVAAKDFSESGTPDDAFGHGTHVAGIITGNGAASGGEILGVAPDAQIMNGKVLDDSGFGSDSSIIAGMEWAASGGADVVNMSLGAMGWYTDGTDPMAMAVDQISAANDVLFVIAAGNDGGYSTINTPGSSSLALTVSAVDANDAPAEFTSRGPRIDGMAKPDLAAPGDQILAPQVGYPTEADEPYVAHSGTSMATPHVAGVAALLVQARPELDSQQLKSILVGSAEDVGSTVFDVGSGRVFAPSAIDQDVYTSPSALGFGIFPFPQTEAAAVTQTLTYVNTSRTATTLTLEAKATLQDGSTAADGALTLDRNTLSIPAGGSADVEVTVDPAAAGSAVGRVGGTIVATDPGGDTVRTAVMSVNEAESYNLTLKGTFRDGSPAAFGGAASVTPLGEDAVDLAYEQVFPELGPDGTATVRLPAGTYGVAGLIGEFDPETYEFKSLDALNVPEVELDGDVTVELDATGSVPLTARTARKSELAGVDYLLARSGMAYSTAIGWTTVGSVSAGAVPSEPVSIGEFIWMHRQLRIPVGADVFAGDYPYLYDLSYNERERIPESLTYSAMRTDVAQVRADYNSVAGGTSWVFAGRFAADEALGWATAMFLPVQVPIVRDEYVNVRPDLWWRGAVDPVAGGSLLESPDPWKVRAGGTIAERWLHQVHHVSAVNGFVGTFGEEGGGGWMVHSVPVLSDDHGHAMSYAFEEGPITVRTRLWSGGKLVDDQPYPFVGAPAPAPGTPVRALTETTVDHPEWTLSTRMRTEWRYLAPQVPGVEELAEPELLNVRYGLTGVDDLNATKRTARLSLSVVDGHGVKATELKGVKAWMSTDDGRTWKALKIKGKGADRKVTVIAPKGADTISLKVQAWKAGSKVTDTVIDAIDVR